MFRQPFLVAALLLAAPGAATAAEPCRRVVDPGHSIGPVRLGMTVNDLRAAATVKSLSERKLALQFEDGGQIQVELDSKLKVERVRIDASQVCVAGATERVIDLMAPSSSTVTPHPDCGLSAAVHRSSWQCPEIGVEYFWERETRGATVFKPSPIKPFVAAPPPRPTPPKPVVQCEPAPDGGEKKCTELPPPDPCAGNVAPMPQIACGFFGRNEQLAIQCYLTDLCMGVFEEGVGDRIEVRGEDGALLGGMRSWNDGRALRYGFRAAPKVGAKIRIIIDGTVAALPPEKALQNPAVSPEEAQARVAVGAAVPVRVRHVVGARALPGGFVLDLKVPKSAVGTGGSNGELPAK